MAGGCAPDYELHAQPDRAVGTAARRGHLHGRGPGSGPLLARQAAAEAPEPALALGFPGETRRFAFITQDGLYRYVLARIWDRSLPLVNWIMLNPSTADGQHDDPTIRRCLGFTRAWGYGGLLVTNLFALRATDPAALTRHADPVGPSNDAAILTYALRAALHVAAWGAHRMAVPRARAIRQMGLPRLTCLGHTRDGQPLHPLYVPAVNPLVPLEGL